MIPKYEAEQVLARALSCGGDFAEIYVERTKENQLSYVNHQVDKLYDNMVSGASVRVFDGLRCVSASTSDLSLSGLLSCAARAAEVLGQGKAPVEIHLREQIPGDIHPIRVVPAGARISDKLDLVREAYEAAKADSQEISQVSAELLDFDHRILVANSEGLFTQDRQIRTRLVVNAVASAGGENQLGSCSPGRRSGLEMFEEISPGQVGRKAARQAVTMLHAGYCPAGQMTVAIENGFGGVIFHEACGHSLEAESVAAGLSQFGGKLGQKIANEKVTAIDDGTIPNAWGSINIDDEGMPARKNVLIENGILKSYLVDKLNGRRMGLDSTASSRRQSYTFPTTSRMTNTYIAEGNDDNKEIIASIEDGLYCREMGGGSVNPVTGAFNFAVREGYRIRNGKICEPLRGASLIGTGSEILQNIDMVGKNLEMGQGMCGASSGSIPTNVGQPLVRVSRITVGGR